MKGGERVFSAVFGLFLLGVGLYALVVAELPAVWPFVGGASLGVLGGNMLFAACTGRPSWLSRLGPLP